MGYEQKYKPGMKFGMLTITRRKGNDAECLCDCGGTVTARMANIVSGNTKSCGCIDARRIALKKTPRQVFLVRVYDRMRQRCYNPKSRSYKWYGAKGVTIAPEWGTETAFVAWGETTYVEGLEIERKDSNGPYSPTNCTWATRTQQVRNRGCTLRVTNGQETKPLAEVCEILGIPLPRAQYVHQKVRAQGENPPHFRHFQELAARLLH